MVGVCIACFWLAVQSPASAKPRQGEHPSPHASWEAHGDLISLQENSAALAHEKQPNHSQVLGSSTGNEKMPSLTGSSFPVPNFGVSSFAVCGYCSFLPSLSASKLHFETCWGFRGLKARVPFFSKISLVRTADLTSVLRD